MDEYSHTDFEDVITQAVASEATNTLILRGRSPYKSVIQILTNGISRPEEDANMLANFLSSNLDKATFDAFKVYFMNHYILPEIQAQGQLMNALMGIKPGPPMPITKKTKGRKDTANDEDFTSD